MRTEPDAAREYLERLRHSYHYIRQLEEELESIMPVSAIRIDREPTGQHDKSSGMPIAVLRLAKSEEVNRAIRSYLILKHEIIGKLEVLPEAKHIEILYYRYVSFLSIKDISEKMNWEYRYTSKIHNDALRSFAEILDVETDKGNEPAESTDADQ